MTFRLPAPPTPYVPPAPGVDRCPATCPIGSTFAQVLREFGAAAPLASITPPLLRTQQGAFDLVDVASPTATPTTAAIFSGAPNQAYLSVMSLAAPHIGNLATATALRWLSSWDEVGMTRALQTIAAHPRRGNDMPDLATFFPPGGPPLHPIATIFSFYAVCKRILVRSDTPAAVESLPLPQQPYNIQPNDDEAHIFLHWVNQINAGYILPQQPAPGVQNQPPGNQPAGLPQPGASPPPQPAPRGPGMDAEDTNDVDDVIGKFGLVTAPRPSDHLLQLRESEWEKRLLPRVKIPSESCIKLLEKLISSILTFEDVKGTWAKIDELLCETESGDRDAVFELSVLRGRWSEIRPHEDFDAARLLVTTLPSLRSAAKRFLQMLNTARTFAQYKRAYVRATSSANDDDTSYDSDGEERPTKTRRKAAREDDRGKDPKRTRSKVMQAALQTVMANNQGCTRSAAIEAVHKAFKNQCLGCGNKGPITSRCRSNCFAKSAVHASLQSKLDGIKVPLATDA